jgi:dephospho-CoA kinase
VKITGGKKPIIGILGGICSGKSTVAAKFAKLGCAVIDADQIAKEMLDEPAIQPKIVKLFGEKILDRMGKIDRQKLAKIVFSDPSQLAALTNIVHPPVLEKTNEMIGTYKKSDVLAIVLDMPLLAEVGWEKRCDKLIFVACEPRIRFERAEKRGLGDENKLKIRENFQISLDKKEEMSDYILHNNSDMSELALQVSRVFNCIMNNS